MIPNRTKYLIGLIIVLPIIVHFFLLSRHSLDIPYKDDYRVILNYLYHYFHFSSFWEAVFLPENENHPVIMRLIVLSHYHILGRLDFQYILWFCNLFLVVSYCCLALHFYRRKEFWNIGVLSLLMLHPFMYEMYFRNDVGTYQLVSFALTIFVFYCASYYSQLNTLTRTLFFIAFMATPFGSINGFLGSAIVVMYFLVNKENRKVLIALSIILAVQIALTIAVSGDGKSISIMTNIVKYNYELVYAFFLSFGGIFTVVSSPAIWPFIAVVSFAIFWYTFYQLFFPFTFKLNFEKLVFIFSAVSLALIVILRYNYWQHGYISVLESRYKIYGALVIILFFSILARKYALKIWVKPSITLFLILLYLVGLYKGVNILRSKNMEQFVEAYNTTQDVFREDFAVSQFINKERRSFLEKHKVYSFSLSDKIAKNVFVEKNRLKNVSSHKFEELSDDPLSKGDYGLFFSKLSFFQVEGSFPKKAYYFVRFNGKDNKTCLQYLAPEPKWFYEKLFQRKNTINTLVTPFYIDTIVGIDFDDFEIYGVDDLGV